MTFTPVVLDTNDMPVAEIDGHPGAMRQYLLTGDDIEGFVQIFYGPPGFTDKTRAVLTNGPHRHYHRTVNERHYILGGDYPIWHWSDPSNEGTLTRVRRHHYLENPPGTLHGIKPEAAPITGWKILHWTTGYGTEIHEPGAAEETIEVGFGLDDEGGPFGAPILVDALAPSWQAHDIIPQWLLKPLSGRVNNSGAVVLVNIPAGAGSETAEVRPATGEIVWLFMVSGDLTAGLETDGEVSSLSLHEGHFVAWSHATRLCIPAGAPSAGGCVVLCVGHKLAD